MQGLAHGELTGGVIGAAIAVHTELGPGFLESVYEAALTLELGWRGVSHVRQPLIQVEYRGRPVGAHRLDLLVEDRIVVELKAVHTLRPEHFAVVRSYLRAMRREHGLLLNFGGPALEVRRVRAAS